MTYTIGDVVFWGTPTTAGEYTFIGHPRGDKAGKVLVLAHSGEVGQEIDADECSPTGGSNSMPCQVSSLAALLIASENYARSQV